jgi:hypothetical protein
VKDIVTYNIGKSFINIRVCNQTNEQREERKKRKTARERNRLESNRQKINERLERFNRIFTRILRGKYSIQCLLCGLALIAPWYRFAQKTHVFYVTIGDYEGIPILGVSLILIFSLYGVIAMRQSYRPNIIRRIEVLNSLSVIWLLEVIAYPRYHAGIGNQVESTSLYKFMALGYSIYPEIGYLAVTLLVLSIIGGLLTTFSLNYIKRLIIYSDEEVELAY